MEAVDRAYVFRPGEGREIDLGNYTMTVRADEQSSSGAFTVLEADDRRAPGRRCTSITASPKRSMSSTAST